MISQLFGDENVRALNIPSVMDINYDHCVKLTNNYQSKLYCMNISEGE